MSSFQYAGQDYVAYNPSTKDLDMALNSITNCVAFQSLEVNTGIVNVATNITFKDGSYSTVISALGLNENQSYNLPPVAGTSGQVLGLDGNSGQLRFYDVSGSVNGITSVNSCIGATTILSNNLDITTDIIASTITIDYPTPPGGVLDLNGCTGSVSLVSTGLEITPNVGLGEVALEVRGGVMNSLNGLQGAVGFTSTTLTVDQDVGANAVTIELANDVVTSVGGLIGDVVLTSNLGSVVINASGQEIDLSVAVPIPPGATEGDYPAWSVGGGSYTTFSAPVTTMNGLNNDVTLTNTDGTIVGDVSGQTIDFRVAVPVPVGFLNGDYPSWDVGTSSYVYTLAPVASVNSINGTVSIQSTGTLAFAYPGGNVINMDVVGGSVVNAVNTITGLVTIEASDDLAVDTSGQIITIRTVLPSGLASPAAGDIGNSSFTISGVSVLLTSTSVVQATVQNPDNLATPYTCWLMYAYPIASVAGDGGSITFVFSDPISVGSTLLVAWSVDKAVA
jgi:hypothetical protein